MKDEELICERCEKDFEELVTREGFCVTYYVEWICESCFKELEGVTWEEYKRKDYVG